MTLKLEIQSVYEILQKIDKEKKKTQESSDNLFGGLKVIPKTFPSAKLVFDKQKFRQYFAQPFNFVHIIKFLDIKSILNVGTLNKEFNVFISSIYIYKILHSSKCKKQTTTTKVQNLSPKSVSSSTSAKSNKSLDSAKKNLMGGLLKNVGNFFFGSMIENKPRINPNELSLKISLHEEILLKMKKRIELESEVKSIREVIESYITSKNINLGRKTSDKESDKEYLSINRDVIRKEHVEIEKEVNSLKKEIDKLKRQIDYFEMNDIEKAKSLSSLKSYVSNNMKFESLKLSNENELKSGKFSHLYDFDISCLAYYDEFLKQDN